MTQFILAISGYAFSGIILFFTLFSFWGLKTDSNSLKKKLSGLQITLMFVFHAAAFFVMFYLTNDFQYVYFYGFQAVIFFAFCVLARVIYPSANKFMINFICFGLMIGMVILTRISMTKSIRQFIIATVSLAVALLLPVLVKKMKFLSSMPVFYGVLGVGLLGVVYMYGAVTNGSKISYSVFGFTFQPSEFVKIIYIFFLASMLHKSIQLNRVFLSAIVACLHVVILVFSKDLGSALLFFIAYICVLFVSTKKPFYLIAGLVSACAASVVAYKLFTHVQVRFLAWQDPWTNIDKEGYQITQSLFAICSGKWFGMGLFHGSPRSIPFVEADFVFSAIAQELGVAFAICLILLYLSCFLHICKMAMNLRNRFYRLITVGLGVIMIFQVFLTIGGGVKLIPSTGVTLPLISYGGSSVMTTIIMFGILLGISLIEAWEKENGRVYATGYEDNEEDEEASDEFYVGSSEKFELVAIDSNGKRYGFNYDEFGFAYDSHGNIYNADGYPVDADGVVYDEEAYPEVYLRPETRAILYLNTHEHLSPPVKTKHDGKAVKGMKQSHHHNFEIVVIGTVFTLAFVGMSGFIGDYVFHNDVNLIANDYNPVQNLLAKQNSRGDILSRDGDQLAYTTYNGEHEEVRVYPYGSLFGHVVGYASLGRSGIESYANAYLIQCNASLNTKMEAELNDSKNPGDSIYTTLDVDVQQAAKDAIGAYTGAVIVTDVKTGEILCMYSNPGFDPNDIENVWKKVIDDEKSTVLLNRVTQGLYPPGSTFKIITSLEYLKEYGDAYQNYSFQCNGSYQIPAGTIHCYHSMSHGTVDFTHSFAKSCNSSFANIGLALNKHDFSVTLEELMFNGKLPYDMPYSVSSVHLDENTIDYDCMQTSIGQGTTLITPLHLNMITCAIANDGMLMHPYLVTKVVDADGNTVKTFSSSEYKRLLTKEESDIMTEFMTAVVEEGTGKKLQGQPFTAAGKTGSAEFNSVTRDSHAWFTGFAPAEDPQIAITVIVEGVGSGGDFAVPIAKKVLAAYFAKQGIY